MKLFLTFFISFLLRLVLIFYGNWQDEHLQVKYTDIDYIVFTDASRFVAEGQSPYMRSTYRYTPLLSYLVLPSVTANILFGKLLFCVCDLCVGWIIYKMLIQRGVSEKKSIFCSCLWLFNPMIINISTRGNAESVVCLLVLLSLYLVTTKKLILGSLVFGLAVHFKIFPVFYAFPLFFMMNDDYRAKSNKNITKQKENENANEKEQENQKGKEKKKGKGKKNNKKKQNNKEKQQKDQPIIQQNKRSLFKTILHFFNKDRLLFAFLSAGFFFALNILFYYLYGWEFLYETYFYHVIRHDNRHNFSVYFYQLYLSALETQHGSLVSLFAFLPQILLILLFTVKYYKDPIYCCFLNTFVFVMFNKVMTVQYFAWYFCLLPLIVPASKMNIWKPVLLIISWLVTQGFWLQRAYNLEFLGQNTFFSIWAAGILFFLSNLLIITQIIHNHRFSNMFKNGKITKFSFLTQKNNNKKDK
ncbi:pig-m mannosyltransferase [Anaeramoeba flamelloides]|uniref:GPI mannosyltransferase 1 n=1 Tax=Anaeramoeba flamelloides TaxID=1746091 RepID=A0ABQ8XTW4_9EUKA|nr:pig-m mannosyltransferase [Anaeramoeba flamelloides]